MTTFTFCHGAGGSAWEWELVAAELRALGHVAVPVDLPSEDESATWSDHADTVVAALPSTDDVVVVAHSLGAYAGTLLASRLPAKLLVLVTAMIPRHGEPAGEFWANSGHFSAPGVDFSDEVAMFLHDVPEDLRAEATRRARNQAGAPMQEPWPLETWPDVPTRFVLCTEDRFNPPEYMRGAVADRLPGVPVDELAAAHCPYLSKPRELAALLDGYAKEVAERPAPPATP